MLSVIILAFNERDHIKATVESVLQQDRGPGGMEVIVVDGFSSDGTREILTSIASDHPGLRIVDNPRRITPCAMNAGIRAAVGHYVAILGGHTHYARDYLRICLELLDEHPEVCCVGGPIQSAGVGPFGRAAAAVMAHPVGIGNARHRHPNYEGYAEGACFPMFRREVFENVGLYDETLLRNQDDEFNYRLAKSGEKVFISPRARCTYFVRETPAQLFRQYYQYGFWRVAVLRKHGAPASLRQLAPPVFMFLMLLLAAVGWAFPEWWKVSAIALPLIYGATLLGAGASEVKREGWGVALLFPVAAAIMHMAYAAGFATAILLRPHQAGREQQFNKGEHYAA